MAARAGAFEGVVLLLGLVLVVGAGLYFDVTRTPTILLVLVCGAVFYFLSSGGPTQSELQENEETKRLAAVRANAKRKSKRIVDKHLDTLARRRMTLVNVDAYGVSNGQAWNAEVQHFVDNVIRPKLTDEEANTLAGESFSKTFQSMIEDHARLKAEELEQALGFSEDMSPLEFEKWCSLKLAEKGWRCRTTKASGDQGADIVAEYKKKGMKSPVRLIVQCKLYSRPLGNKAVQEAHAARKHYMADHAAVATNADYTKSARQLAQTTGVFLWHYSDLDRALELISVSRSRSNSK